MRIQNKTLMKILAMMSAFSGVLVLTYVFYPIIFYEWDNSNRFGTYLSPVPNHSQVNSPTDYTKASNWFEEDSQKEEDKFKSAKISYYTISIPRLRITDATVAIGGENLSDSLIQYPGTALPGKRGNAVIFGHSVLPQFYDPKNYLTIFSTLPALKAGDEVLARYDGVAYKYVVEDMFEVSPTDIQVLEQNQSDSFLTLVTCTPPGHPLRPKRLIVRARVVPFRANAGETANRN